MSSVRFPIHHTFGPLVTQEQWKLAFLLQFFPQKWKRGLEIEELRSSLSHHFGMSASLFGSGREALLAALKSLDMRSGDEVIVQGYTCVVVPNAVHAAGATVVYADIDPESLNLDLKKIQTKITPRTRAIICQHTFGIPADTERLRAICDKRNLMLIEDMAHVLPETLTEGMGTRGDVIILSFGRDKAISGVTGGAVLTKYGAIGQKIDAFEKEARHYSSWRILNLIGYPVRYHFARAIWNLPFGATLAKGYLRWSRMMRLLPPVYASGEKEGKTSIQFHRIPNACATLVLEQFQSLSSLNQNRRSLAKIYADAAKKKEWSMPHAALNASTLQKFPVYARDAKKLRAELKREQVYLDDGWCSGVVNPSSVNQESAGYMRGTCPIAEDVSRHIVTLPVHPTMSREQAGYLVHALFSHGF